MEEQRQQAHVADLARFGYKQGGYDKSMGIYALEEYMQIKHVMASHD